jgi:hypothetical protein
MRIRLGTTTCIPPFAFSPAHQPRQKNILIQRPTDQIAYNLRTLLDGQHPQIVCRQTAEIIVHTGALGAFCEVLHE